jgi:proline iminopeptidase
MSNTAQQLFGEAHVRRYRETDGEVGYIWKEGSTILLLTTTGRSTGRETTTPLIYNLDGDTPVIVASKGGARDHPGWFKNLAKTPEVGIQIKGESSAPGPESRRARSASASGS